MNTIDIMALVHPALAVGVVFPIIGMAVSRAWQTRQRRIETQENKQKSKIPPTVGREHLDVGKWLTSSVIGVTLIAFAYSIYFKGIFQDLTREKTPQAILILLIFAVTIASLVFLYKAKASQPLWRGVFATLTGIGVVILGFQEGVFRRDYEWYISHFYFGITAALLMIISLAIVPEIYKNKRWRTAHTALNCIALLLFFSQGLTGARDLLEIPLSWQKQHLYQCDWNNKTCPSQQSQLLELYPAETVNLSPEEMNIRPQ